MVKAVGIQKKLDKFTDAEFLWYKFHTLIDDGFYYCIDCERVIHPLHLESYQRLQLGEHEGHIRSNTKPYHALYCPYCGKSLFPERIEIEQSETNYCIACDRHYGNDTNYCALCGNSLGDDIANKLLRIGQDKDSTYEDFQAAFMTLTNAEVVPLSIHERFMKLCDSEDGEISRMSLLQMQSSGIGGDENVRKLMLGKD